MFLQNITTPDNPIRTNPTSLPVMAVPAAPHIEPFIAQLDQEIQLENQLQQLLSKLEIHYRVFAKAVIDAYKFATLPLERIVYEKIQDAAQTPPIKRLNIASINITRIIGSFSFILIPRGATQRPLPPFWWKYTKQVLVKIPVLFRYQIRFLLNPPGTNDARNQYHRLHLSSMIISSLGLINILLIAAQVQHIDEDYEQCLVLIHSILKELVICCIPESAPLQPTPSTQRPSNPSRAPARLIPTPTPTTTAKPTFATLSSFKNKLSSKIGTKLSQLKTADYPRATTPVHHSSSTHNNHSTNNSPFYSPHSPSRTPAATVSSTANESLRQSNQPHDSVENSHHSTQSDDDDLIIINTAPQTSKILQQMHNTVITQLCTNLKLILSDNVLKIIQERDLIDFRKDERFYLVHLPTFINLVINTLLGLPVDSSSGVDSRKALVNAWKGNFNILGSIIGISRFYSHFNSNLVLDTTQGDLVLGIDPQSQIQPDPAPHPELNNSNHSITNSAQLSSSDSTLLQDIDTQLDAILRQQHSHLYLKSTFYLNIFETFLTTSTPRIISFIQYVLLVLYEFELERQKPDHPGVQPNNFLSTHIELLDTSYEYDYINFDLEQEGSQIDETIRAQQRQQQQQQNRLHARLEDDPHHDHNHNNNNNNNNNNNFQHINHQPAIFQYNHTAHSRLLSLYQLITEYLLTLFTSVDDYTDFVNKQPFNIRPQAILEQVTRKQLFSLLSSQPHRHPQLKQSHHSSFYDLYMSAIFSHVVPISMHVERNHRLFFEQLACLNKAMLPSIQELFTSSISSEHLAIAQANYRSITYWGQILNEYLLTHFSLAPTFDMKQRIYAPVYHEHLVTIHTTPTSLRNSCSLLDQIISNSTYHKDLYQDQHDHDDFPTPPTTSLVRYQSTSPLPSTHPVFGFSPPYQHLLAQSSSYAATAAKLQLEQFTLTNKLTIFSHLLQSLYYLQQSYKITPYVPLQSSIYLDYISNHTTYLEPNRSQHLILSDDALSAYQQWFQPNWSSSIYITTFNKVKAFPPHLYLENNSSNPSPHNVINGLPDSPEGRALHQQRVNFIKSARSLVVHRRRLFYTMEAAKAHVNRLDGNPPAFMDLSDLVQYHYNLTPRGECDWATPLTITSRCSSFFPNTFHAIRQILANLSDELATTIFHSLDRNNIPHQQLTFDELLTTYSNTWIHLLLHKQFAKLLKQLLACFPWTLIQPGVVSDYDLIGQIGVDPFEALGPDDVLLDHDGQDEHVIGLDNRGEEEEEEEEREPVFDDTIDGPDLVPPDTNPINRSQSTPTNHSLSPLMFKQPAQSVADEVNYLYTMLPSLAYLFTSNPNFCYADTLLNPPLHLFVDLLNNCLFGLAHTLCDTSIINNTHMFQQPLRSISPPPFLPLLKRPHLSTTLIATDPIMHKSRSQSPPASTYRSLQDFFTCITEEPECYQYNATRLSYSHRDIPITTTLYHPHTPHPCYQTIPIPLEFSARTLQFVIECFIDVLASDSEQTQQQLQSLTFLPTPQPYNIQFQPLHKQPDLAFPSYPQPPSQSSILASQQFPHPIAVCVNSSSHLPYFQSQPESPPLPFLTDFSVTNLYTTRRFPHPNTPTATSTSPTPPPITPIVDLCPHLPITIPFRQIVDSINDGLIG